METITLNEQANYRLMEISKTKDYFEAEIRYKQILTNRLSKCITCFDYKDKVLTVFFLLFLAEQIYFHMSKQKKDC